MRFSFRVTDEKFEEAKKMIVKNGGVIYASGFFEIKGIQGTINKMEDRVSIVIAKKPFIISWGMIEEKLNDFF